jgi:hypothetical protein
MQIQRHHISNANAQNGGYQVTPVSKDHTQILEEKEIIANVHHVYTHVSQTQVQ